MVPLGDILKFRKEISVPKKLKEGRTFLVLLAGSDGTVWPLKILQNFVELFWSVRVNGKKATIIVVFHFVTCRLKTGYMSRMVRRFEQAGTGPSCRHIQGSKKAKGLPRVNLQYSKIEKAKKWTEWR